MESIIQSLLRNLSEIHPVMIYAILFFSAVLQMTVPPYPGDTVLLVGGCLVSLGMKGGNFPIFASYVIGTVLSSYALYMIGLRNGEAVLNFKLVVKYFPEASQRKVKTLIWKYGLLIFFLCKFIPGISSITIIFGGIFKYNPILTCFVVAISSVVHNYIFFAIGKGIGYNLDKIDSFLSSYNTIAMGLLLIGIGIFLFSKYKKSNN